MITTNDWPRLSQQLIDALALTASPIGISFSSPPPGSVPAFDEPMSPPTADGRSGRVAASCVFWIAAADHAFTTVPADHGNCSVGRVVHGLAGLEDVAHLSDVATLVGSGWVSETAVGATPTVARTTGMITYGPLGAMPLDPEVVLLRIDGRQLMLLSDAVPGLRVEGKPQCQIIAIAKEAGEAAVSVGCSVSRVRTGMGPEEMTCAIPAHRLREVVAAVCRVAAIDTTVAEYAVADARRFATTA